MKINIKRKPPIFSKLGSIQLINITNIKLEIKYIPKNGMKGNERKRKYKKM